MCRVKFHSFNWSRSSQMWYEDDIIRKLTIMSPDPTVYGLVEYDDSMVGSGWVFRSWRKQRDSFFGLYWYVSRVRALVFELWLVDCYLASDMNIPENPASLLLLLLLPPLSTTTTTLHHYLLLLLLHFTVIIFYQSASDLPSSHQLLSNPLLR